MSGQLNGSVLTAFAILKLLSESRPTITTQEVSRELKINSTTAYRFLRTLEVAGALVAIKRGQYRLSAMLSDLGERALANNTLARMVQPYLNEISERLKESVLATANHNNRTVVIARARSARPYSVNIDVGVEMEAHCTANGKLWLANLTDEEFGHYLTNTERKAFTENTIVDVDRLTETIRITREVGHAKCVGEREDEMSAVAVPVLSTSGRMIMGVSVFGPNSHFTEAFCETAIQTLQEVAAQVQASLYGSVAVE